MRFIIGPSGKVLKEIEANCAVKVKIPRNEDWTGSISVSGDFEGVAMARDAVLSIVQERANKTNVTVEIERTLAPFLWNKDLSGISQQEISEAFPAVKINLVKSGEGAQLYLSGDRFEIEKIQTTFIAAALIRLRSSIKSVSTFVPKALHRLLIGPKGAVLHQLEEETGCGISVPSAKDEPENQQVAIYGPEDKLLKGLSLLMEKTKGLASEKLQIPEISFKLLQNLAKYRNELKSFDSDISFHLNSQNCSIEVDGKKENVMSFLAKARELLTQLAAYKVQETLEVDQEYLKHVIGRKGHNLQQIQKEFDVEIVIEEEKVSFIGKSGESVKRALEHVNGIVSSVVDMLTMTAKIDSKYHGILIGSKGSNLTSYTEKYPSVMINFSSEGTESVKFKGPRVEVEACYAEMMAQADTIRHEMIMNSYTQSLQLTAEDNKILSKSSRDFAFLTNFARQHDCKLILDADELSLTLQGCKKAVDVAFPLLKEQLQMIKDRDSLTFTVDPQFHGILIGSEGRNLKHLIQKYSVKIDFPKNAKGEAETDTIDTTDNTAAADVIKITGPRSNITKARDELLDLLKYHQEHDHQETIQVPVKTVPGLIGKNGSVVDNIKIESDCKIDFLEKSADDGDVRIVKLSGTKESISQAKKLITDLVKELMDQIEEKVETPSPEFLKSLTGTFKREYRKITSKYDDLQFYARDSVIKIKGNRDNVTSAVKEMKCLVKNIESGEFVKEELQVLARVHGKILGQGGANIKELVAEFDCEIFVPRHGQPGPVTISGPKESVGNCSAKIRSYCQEERLFKFPSAALKTEIMARLGKDKSVFGKVQWNPHSYGILLVGETEEIEAVKARLSQEFPSEQ